MVTKTGGGTRFTKSQRIHPVHGKGSAESVSDEYTDLVRAAATGDPEGSVAHARTGGRLAFQYLGVRAHSVHVRDPADIAYRQGFLASEPRP